MLYDLKKMLFELYKIYVYCKHGLIFLLLIYKKKKSFVETAIEYCNLYSVMDGFFCQPDLLCYHCVPSPSPESVLNLCFLCTMSLVASHKPEANKIPVISKNVVLVLS